MMTTAATANDETEILGQQHAVSATAAAANVAEIFEQKHAATTAPITNEESEMLQHLTAVTATRKEGTIDSKDQKLFSLH